MRCRQEHLHPANYIECYWRKSPICFEKKANHMDLEIKVKRVTKSQVEKSVMRLAKELDLFIDQFSQQIYSRIENV